MDQAALQGSRPRAQGPHTGHQGEDQTVDTTLIPAPNPATHRQIGATDAKYGQIQALFQALAPAGNGESCMADAKRGRIKVAFQTVTLPGNSHYGPTYPGGEPARNH